MFPREKLLFLEEMCTLVQMKRSFFVRTVLVWVLPLIFASTAGAVDEDGSEVIYRSVYEKIAPKADLPMNQLVLEVAKCFLGTKYVSGTLESETEELRIYLDRTDCILFVEMCTGFALTVKGLRIEQVCDGEHYGTRPRPSVSRSEPSYELLCDNIRNMRYRSGVLGDYSSRLHYTTEWILQNETNGIMKEVTSELGIPVDQKFSFMSAHRDLYRQLVADPSLLPVIIDTEKRLEAQGPYFKVPQARLKTPAVIGRIKDGDIIAFVDRNAGLDVSHVAFAYTVDGVMHFIHASSKAGKVIIESRTLADYAANGVRVIRLNEVQ